MELLDVSFLVNHLCVAGSLKLLPLTRIDGFSHLYDESDVIKTLTLIAVGVGIAPMIQILRYILESPNSAIRVVLLYGVVSLM